MRIAAWLALALLAAGPARADVLTVGAGKAFATPCAAIAAAKPADVIEITAATYTDSCAITGAGQTLRGVGGRPKIDLSGSDHPAQYKGIYVVAADDVTIENLELTGAHISADNGLNAAGIRVEAKNLSVRGCYIHDNQNGILGGTSGTITIEYSEFARNAAGDGCNEGGCTHNLYIANIDTLNFRYNWSHRLATDTPDKGHLLKSRAKANYILYNRLSGEDGFDSYELDLPNGGLAVIVGNVIQKGAQSGNGTLLAWGEEGASNPDKRVLIVNNTFINERSSGAFLNTGDATLSLHNNIFAGAGNVPAALTADNLAGTDPQFVDRAQFDYHLQASSLARGKAVAAGMVDQIALAPEYEYLHPAGRVARATVADVGAFEFGTSQTGGTGAGGGGDRSGAGAGGDGASGSGGRTAGAGTGDARSGAGGGSGSAGSGEARDAGDLEHHAGASNESTGSDGCACSAPGTSQLPRGHARGGADALLFLLLLLRRRLRAGYTAVSLAGLCWLVACASDSAAEDAGAAGRAGRDAGAAGRAGEAGAMDSAGTGGTAADSGGGAGKAAADSGGGAGKPEAGSGGGAALCPELGWCELPDTKLEAVCPDPKEYPDIQGYEGCGGVINDWSGGMADTKRNRLLIWGGGHHGYFGNELYALDLSRGEMVRLNEPSDVAGVDFEECQPPERYRDGLPSSRHTYDGLTYVVHADRLFTLAGSGVPCGYGLRTSWTLDLAALEWQEMKADPYPTKAAFGVVSDYDPVTKRVVLADGYNLWAYELEADRYVLLNDSNQTNAHIDYHMTGRVDPERGLFVAVGGGSAASGGMQVFDIRGDSAQQNWTGEVSGCDALLAANSPGWSYDPEQRRLVGWAGGDVIYVFDPETKRCNTQTFGGGPGKQNENGTFGRFRYFPALRLFAVVNNYRSNAFALRLTR